MSITKYESVPVTTGVQMFVYKKVIEGLTEKTGSTLDFDLLTQMVNENFQKPLYDVAFIKEYFLFYRKVLKVRHLADYVANAKAEKNPDYGEKYSTKSRIHLMTERLRLQPAFPSEAGSNRDLRVQLYNAMPYLTRGTLYSEDCWRYFGGQNRLEYNAFKTFVTHVLEMCPGMVGTNVSIGDKALHLQRLHELNDMHNHLELGIGVSSQFRLNAYSDLEKVSFYASFDTLSSLDCYKYLGERFRLTASSKSDRRKIIQEHVEHLGILAKILFTKTPEELVRIRGVIPKDPFRRILARKMEMIELRKRFGSKFQTWRCGYKESVSEHRNYGLKMKIFWGMVFDNTSERSSSAIDIVINKLIEGDVIARRPVETYKTLFLDGLQNGNDANFFFCSATEFKGVIDKI